MEFQTFLSGALSIERLEEIGKHLEECSSCRLTIEDVVRMERENDSLIRVLGQISHADLDGEDTTREEMNAKNLCSEHPLICPEDDPSFTLNQDVVSFPEQIGRFHVLRLLGSGGFGNVFLAQDPKLNREIALKIPLDHALMTAESRRRFVWEGQAAASLNHPNLVSVYEAAEYEGIPYIASEYCDGLTLAEFIASPDKQLSPLNAAHLIHEIAKAVQHAHSRGILHRDIKPRNVLLEVDSEGSVICEDGSSYTPKLADFGLAKSIVSDENANDRDATRTGMLLGTPAYMSPEQLRGEIRGIDIRTDIYGLGVVFYELITGNKPYQGKSVVEIVSAMSRMEPQSLSQVTASIPRDLETICLKCLRQEAQQRYNNADELLDDLGRFFCGDPILARPVGRVEKMLRWAKKRPASALLAVLICILPLLMIVGLTWHNRELGEALKRAESSESVTKQHLYSANIRLASQAWNDSHVKVYRALMDFYRTEASGTDDPRGLEWYYLASLNHQFETERIWTAHDGGICSLRFSPNGKRLATSSTDGLIKLWDVETEQPLLTLQGHIGDVNKIAFSPDSRRLVSGGDDGTVRLWDVESGTAQQVLRGHAGRVFEVVFARGGKRVISAGDGDGIRFWICDSGEPSIILPANNVRGLAVHPEMPYLAAAERSDMIHVTEYGGMRRMFETQTGEAWAINDLAYSHAGGRLVAASRDGAARVINPLNGDILLTLKGHRGSVQSAKYSPDDHWIATAGRDGTVMLWDAEGQPAKVFRGHTDQVWSLDFAPDDSILATGDRTGQVRFWNWKERNDHRLKKIAEDLGFLCPSTAAFLPGQDFLVSTCNTAAFQILDTKSGECLQRFGDESHAEQVAGLAASPDGGRVATCGKDGQLILWNLKTKEIEKQIQAHAGGVWDIEFSSDGRLIATGGEDYKVRLWDVGTGQQLADCTGHRKPVLAVSFSPKDPLLATAGVDRTVILWNTKTFQQEFVLEGHQDVVSRIAFSPNGEILATAGHDSLIILWDVASGQQLRTLQGHSDFVRCVSFSADGRTILSGDKSGAFKFWQTNTGFEMFGFDHRDPEIRCIAVSAGNRSFIVASAKDKVTSLYLWENPFIEAGR